MHADTQQNSKLPGVQVVASTGIRFVPREPAQRHCAALRSPPPHHTHTTPTPVP